MSSGNSSFSLDSNPFGSLICRDLFTYMLLYLPVRLAFRDVSCLNRTIQNLLHSELPWKFHYLARSPLPSSSRGCKIVAKEGLSQWLVEYLKRLSRLVRHSCTLQMGQKRIAIEGGMHVSGLRLRRHGSIAHSCFSVSMLSTWSEQALPRLNSNHVDPNDPFHVTFAKKWRLHRAKDVWDWRGTMVTFHQVVQMVVEWMKVSHHIVDVDLCDNWDSKFDKMTKLEKWPRKGEYTILCGCKKCKMDENHRVVWGHESLTVPYDLDRGGLFSSNFSLFALEQQKGSKRKR